MAPLSNYQPDEVRALVESYVQLREVASPSSRRMWIFVRMLDLDRALPRLEPVLRQALYLCGVLGLTHAEASRVSGIGVRTMDRRYPEAIERLTACLNGSPVGATNGG